MPGVVHHPVVKLSESCFALKGLRQISLLAVIRQAHSQAFKRWTRTSLTSRQPAENSSSNSGLSCTAPGRALTRRHRIRIAPPPGHQALLARHYGQVPACFIPQSPREMTSRGKLPDQIPDQDPRLPTMPVLQHMPLEPLLVWATGLQSRQDQEARTLNRKAHIQPNGSCGSSYVAFGRRERGVDGRYAHRLFGALRRFCHPRQRP